MLFLLILVYNLPTCFKPDAVNKIVSYKGEGEREGGKERERERGRERERERERARERERELAKITDTSDIS